MIKITHTKDQKSITVHDGVYLHHSTSVLPQRKPKWMEENTITIEVQKKWIEKQGMTVDEFWAKFSRREKSYMIEGESLKTNEIKV